MAPDAYTPYGVSYECRAGQSNEQPAEQANDCDRAQQAEFRLGGEQEVVRVGDFFQGLGAAVLEGSHLLKPLLRHQPLPADLAFPPGSASPALACAVAVAVSAVSGYFAIGLLDRLTRKPRLNPLAFYCLCAGALMIILGTVGAEGLFGIQGMSLK